jgi:oligoribonuclease
MVDHATQTTLKDSHSRLYRSVNEPGFNLKEDRMTESEGQFKRADQFYVWFDTEYSTLELDTACLLQVAALITDTSLNRVLPPEQDIRLAIRIPVGKTISPWVEENLSELVRTCRSPQAVDLVLADERLAGYVDTVAGVPNQQKNLRPVLAGNTIHADWWLIRRFLPRFLNRLHYRHLDVTALKLEWMRLHPEKEFQKENPEIIRRYFSEALLPDSRGRHDAYYDLQASIAELAFYRRHFLRTD